MIMGGGRELPVTIPFAPIPHMEVAGAAHVVAYGKLPTHIKRTGGVSHLESKVPYSQLKDITPNHGPLSYIETWA